MTHNFVNENPNNHSWIKSSRNVVYSDNILEAELECCDGSWNYNKIEIPLNPLGTMVLSNDNGTFKYITNFFEDNEPHNSWLKSSRNVVYSNNILEAELECCNGDWKYNKLGIHPLLVNKPLTNYNGTFKYSLPMDDDNEIMRKFFPIYDGDLIPYINIKQCLILSVNITKYNGTRNETISILNNYKLPPISTYFGHTTETASNSPFYNCMAYAHKRNEYTLGMLEIFNKFVNESVGNEWLLYFEDDVRPINLDKEQDLTKLYNVPVDAELIRPYLGKNEQCDITNVNYRISYGGGYNHAFYISTNGCKKVLHYATKYKWKHICDIDLYKLATHCGRFPTGFDGWSLLGCDSNNDITDQLEDHEKINMYHLSHCIFNQTSLSCL
jgi:hypothetical protein